MAAETKFNDHTLVDFDKLLIGDSMEIKRLRKEFKTNGWCFVQLPDQNGKLVKKLRTIEKNLLTFFQQDQTIKSKYTSSNSLGYSRVDHKEGIKVLIEQVGLKNLDTPFPHDVQESLEYLSTLIYNLTNIIKTIIYKMSTFAQSPTKDKVELSSLGMLDIVHYFNERTGPKQQPKVGLNTHEVNCVPHFDPGLFSLSILSTCDGLQLNDQMLDKWIDGPNNSKQDEQCIGVIWLGEAASVMTENRFKSGIHRVVYPQLEHQPRLTIWQEVCTQSQIDSLFQNNDNTNRIPGGTSIKMKNQPNSEIYRVKSNGETRNAIMNRMEKKRGIPESKSGIDYFEEVEQSSDSASENENDHEFTAPQQQQQQQRNLSNRLPSNAIVTMNNQPNSYPMKVQPGGETVDNFFKRMENDRGLSMSKSGVRHMDVRVPVRVNKKTEDKPKKKSMFSKIFH